MGSSRVIAADADDFATVLFYGGGGWSVAQGAADGGCDFGGHLGLGEVVGVLEWMEVGASAIVYNLELASLRVIAAGTPLLQGTAWTTIL